MYCREVQHTTSTQQYLQPLVKVPILQLFKIRPQTGYHLGINVCGLNSDLPCLQASVRAKLSVAVILLRVYPHIQSSHAFSRRSAGWKRTSYGIRHICFTSFMSLLIFLQHRRYTVFRHIYVTAVLRNWEAFWNTLGQRTDIRTSGLTVHIVEFSGWVVL